MSRPKVDRATAAMLQMNGAERKRVADSHSNIFNHLGNDDDESALDDQMNKIKAYEFQRKEEILYSIKTGVDQAIKKKLMQAKTPSVPQSASRNPGGAAAQVDTGVPVYRHGPNGPQGGW